MKVEADYVSSNQKIDKSTSSHFSTRLEKTSRRSDSTKDSARTSLDTAAYREQGKSMEDIMQEADNMDAAARKDYMTVMSNSMSAQDFAKLEEDGYPIGTVEVEKIVTVVDKIKAHLVEAGIEISGYTDHLSKDKLEDITGNVSRAAMIASRMEEYDLPNTETNQKEVEKALEKALSLKELTEGSIKYMVENEMEPTIDQIYKAEFSSASDPNRQGKGYFSEGMPGYYGKKAEEYHWEELEPQIEKVIQEAGMEDSKEVQESAKWLVEKGIPLTKESLQQLEEIKKLQLPKREEEIINQIVKAMANGQKAEDANLVEQPYLLGEAVSTKQTVAQIDPNAVNWVLAKNQKITIGNLIMATNSGEHAPQLDTDKARFARRQLEETRLYMSVDANLKLLKRGFSIQTAELEELVAELKKMEEHTGNALYEESIQATKEIAQMPIGVIRTLFMMPRTINLHEIHAEGARLRTQYEAAEKTYEAVMTVPRKDLGDSIQKAFANVDAILEDNNLEQTQANQRAVRILGYNSMEMTEENILKIKEADLSLQRVLKKMTPHHTMELIRKGINPLETEFGNLEKQLQNMSQEDENQADQYAKFLYKLEQNNAISPEEKEAYLGIYRLVKQVEKSDGAVIGSLVNQGADINFKNLLGAVRTNKQRGMNKVVDDNTGMLESTESREHTISQQITNYYTKLAQQIGEEIEPQKMAAIQITPELSLEKLAELLPKIEGSKDAQESYVKDKMNEFRKSEAIDKNVIQMLQDYNQPVTLENLLAADSALNARGDMYRQLDEYYKKSEKTMSEGGFLNKMEAIAESLTGEESANTAFEQMKDAVQQLVELSVETGSMTSKDWKALSILYKQVSFTRNMAKEENYEVPVTINGEITSVNLKILRDKEHAGKVTATMQTDHYGKVAAEFSIQNGMVNGYIAGDKEEGLLELRKIEEAFAKQLEENGFQEGNLAFVESKQLNLDTFGRKETVEKETTTTKDLYFVAKSLIFALQNK